MLKNLYLVTNLCLGMKDISCNHQIQVSGPNALVGVKRNVTKRLEKVDLKFGMSVQPNTVPLIIVVALTLLGFCIDGCFLGAVNPLLYFQ